MRQSLVGLEWLDKAYKGDGYNVRTVNTLNLFENQIPKDYSFHGTKNFRIRYHNDEKPALSRWIKSERDPGPGCASDDQIVDFVRNKGFTVYHPVGTCKMGADPVAVVDQQLKVHGMQNLRVIDASVMPLVTSGNTNAPVIMIAEKAADSILRGE